MTITELGRDQPTEICTTAVAGSSGWEARAACSDAGDELAKLFFSDDLADIGLAKALCADCPVLTDCLETAIVRNEQFGVWGGQLFVGGKVVHFKRARGRPPKNPRPEEHLPQVPIPEHLRERLSA